MMLTSISQKIPEASLESKIQTPPMGGDLRFQFLDAFNGPAYLDHRFQQHRGHLSALFLISQYLGISIQEGNNQGTFELGFIPREKSAMRGWVRDDYFPIASGWELTLEETGLVLKHPKYPDCTFNVPELTSKSGGEEIITLFEDDYFKSQLFMISSIVELGYIFNRLDSKGIKDGFSENFHSHRLAVRINNRYQMLKAHFVANTQSY